MIERRNTGFKDKHGVEIYEGDLVVTRERMPQFRALAVYLQQTHYPDFGDWFCAYGREHGRAWLGVVIELNDGVNPKQWIFQSVNMGATIHDYWADELEVVKLPTQALEFIKELTNDTTTPKVKGHWIHSGTRPIEGCLECAKMVEKK